MRNIALCLMLMFTAEMSGRHPTPFQRPHSTGIPCAPEKVYPLSLRYRQQIDQQIHVPPCQLSGSCTPVLVTCSMVEWLVERAGVLCTHTILGYLLVRMQF